MGGHIKAGISYTLETLGVLPGVQASLLNSRLLILIGMCHQCPRPSTPTLNPHLPVGGRKGGREGAVVGPSAHAAASGASGMLSPSGL